MRRAARQDATHKPIVAELKRKGYLVQDLSGVGRGCPDVLVQTPDGQLRLIELKTATGKLTPDQERFLARGWRVDVLRRPEDVQ